MYHLLYLFFLYYSNLQYYIYFYLNIFFDNAEKEQNFKEFKLIIPYYLDYSTFLEENAIIIIHDIVFHLFKRKNFHPSNIYLFSELVGDKVFIPNEKFGIGNIGAVFLKSNQKKYYINYFILLLSPWQYIPNDKYIKELQIFISKYYKKNIYLYLFNKAVEVNKIFIKK